MKRYWTFFGDKYYPLGGMKDFVGDFEDKFDAIDALVEHESKHNSGQHKARIWSDFWAYVYDMETQEIVWTSSEDHSDLGKIEIPFA